MDVKPQGNEMKGPNLVTTDSVGLQFSAKGVRARHRSICGDWGRGARIHLAQARHGLGAFHCIKYVISSRHTL